MELGAAGGSCNDNNDRRCDVKLLQRESRSCKEFFSTVASS